MIILVYKLTDLDTPSTIADIVFKIVAVFVGTIWALNRYFVARTDITQLRVDSDVNIIRDKEFENNNNLALLIYRLDIVNTGKSLIDTFHHSLKLEIVTPSLDGTQYREIYRWPFDGGFHHGGPIEPGSWSAINNAISVPADIKAVRLF